MERNSHDEYALKIMDSIAYSFQLMLAEFTRFNETIENLSISIGIYLRYMGIDNSPDKLSEKLKSLERPRDDKGKFQKKPEEGR